MATTYQGVMNKPERPTERQERLSSVELMLAARSARKLNRSSWR